MAKTKSRPASAAQRREQERQQRQQRTNTNQNVHVSQSRGRRSRAKKSNSGLLIGGGILLGVLVIVGIFVFIANQPKATVPTATPQVFSTITHVDPGLLSTVGTGGVDSSVKSLLQPVKNTPVLKGPTGKPQFFYMGAE